MRCARCGDHFFEHDLHPPLLPLRIIAAPFFFMFLPRSGVLQREYSAKYCRPCRRQLNAVLFFAAFMVVVFAIMMAVQLLR
jgi:hypothetical protein